MLAENEVHEPLHYKKRLKDVYNEEYSEESIQEALSTLVLDIEEVQLIITKQDEVPQVYPEQFFDGN